jgi:two-component system response regulator AtoC
VARSIAAVTTRYGILPPDEVVLGASGAMDEVRDKLERVACTDAPVLIRGEAGTGKEFLARLIHKRYPGEMTPFHKVTPAGRAGWRKSASFVVSKDEAAGTNGNGHSRQGGSGRPGCIGTLYFDEVTELNSTFQRNLLHLVHEDNSTRMGPSEYGYPLFRTICSTKHDIEREMTLGNFREDLFYSINVVSLRLPPLRARREDIPGWATYFWQSFQAEFDLETPAPAGPLLAALQEHAWPGNLRELANVIRRYVLLGSEDKIINELTERLAPRPASQAPSARMSLKGLSRQEAREVERKIIYKTLRETQWNRKQAARVLNISYRTLLYKIKEAGVPPKRIVVNREKQN